VSRRWSTVRQGRGDALPPLLMMLLLLLLMELYELLLLC
jgi:hypothetical protein